MDYLELSGATISERDKAFAQEFANFVNGSMSSPDQTGRELTIEFLVWFHAYQSPSYGQG